jgi:membrane dipeptidase
LYIAHRDERSALKAIGRYQGTVIASHANVRSLLKDLPGERHLSNATIQELFSRDGIIGVIPFNKFLRPGWVAGEDRRLTSVDLLITHIDTLCQMAGDSLHVGIGSDFDGGFGLQDIPAEMDNISDLQILDGLLQEKGYSPEDTQNILGANWLRMLERNLPDA